MNLDFLASISFYAIPYLTGRFLSKNIIQAWIIGALLWFVALFILPPDIARVAAIAVSAVSVFNLVSDLMKRRSISFSKEHLIYAGILVLSTLVYFLIWKRNTPYPLQLNW